MNILILRKNEGENEQALKGYKNIPISKMSLFNVVLDASKIACTECNGGESVNIVKWEDIYNNLRKNEIFPVVNVSKNNKTKSIYSLLWIS